MCCVCVCDVLLQKQTLNSRQSVKGLFVSKKVCKQCGNISLPLLVCLSYSRCMSSNWACSVWLFIAEWTNNTVHIYHMDQYRFNLNKEWWLTDDQSRMHEGWRFYNESASLRTFNIRFQNTNSVFLSFSQCGAFFSSNDQTHTFAFQ